MKKIFLLATIATCFTGCKKEISQSKPVSGQDVQQSVYSTQITAVKATYYDSLFTRYKAGEWTGGDVASSMLLPDGSSFWLFGDSFVDTVYPDRHRPFDAFIHNSIVTTTPAGSFKTFYGGNARNPKPFFDTASPIILWPSSAFIDSAQTKVYVLMVTVKSTGGGNFGFETVGNTVAILRLSDFKVLDRFTFNDTNTIDWSSATLTDSGYVYIYGAESTDNNKFMHVCRTPASNPFKVVEYYDGTNWFRRSKKSARIAKDLSEQYSVFKYQGKYYLLSQQSKFLSADIYLWDAASPTGPFTNKRKIYTTPETTGNIITYNATAHPELIQDGKLLVGYCTNSFGSFDIWNNADYYRPYFIWVSNWQ